MVSKQLYLLITFLKILFTDVNDDDEMKMIRLCLIHRMAKKACPFLYSELTMQIRQYFFDIQYYSLLHWKN